MFESLSQIYSYYNSFAVEDPFNMGSKHPNSKLRRRGWYKTKKQSTHNNKRNTSKLMKPKTGRKFK